MFSFQMPHGYKKGTALYPHLHYIPANPNAWGTAVWGRELVVSPLSGTAPSTPRSYYMITTSGPSSGLQMNISNWPAIPGSGITESSFIFGRIFRDGSDANDTYEGDIFGVSFDLHYEVNSLGSKNQFP